MRNLVFCFARCNIYILNHPKGADCSDLSKWKSFTTPVYGNCFTFNSNESTEEVKIFKAFFLESSFSLKVAKVTVTGSGNGLVLEMFLDQVLFKDVRPSYIPNKPFVVLFDWIHIFQSNYMHNKLSRKAGARITIHDP